MLTTNPKPWYLSKTIWLNVIAGLLEIAVLAAEFPHDEKVGMWLALVTAGLNVIMRRLTSQPISGSGAAPLMMLALVLTAGGCASGSGSTRNDWLPRVQQLVEGSVSAHTQLLTVAGAVYKAKGAECMVAAARADGSTDGIVLYNCMRPANEARDRVEAAATAYRQAATTILTASSWVEVLSLLPQLRQAAGDLAQAGTAAGIDEQESLELLTAPLDAATDGGN